MISSQLLFTRSMSTMETLEKDVKYAQSWQQKQKNHAHPWRRSGVFICLLSTYFTTFSSVSIVDFQQAIASWVLIYTLIAFTLL